MAALVRGLFADREFNTKLWRTMTPIALQNLMLASVAAADAVMLGRMEQNAMAAVSLATQASYSTRKHIPAEFNEIMKVIKGCSNFIAAAEKMDKEYSKTGQGYWSSDCELLARAGACWIRDRLTSMGIRNDYLVGHSEGEMISPHGEEREVIDSAFDAWLSKAKDVGFFNQQYLLRGKVQEVGVALDISPDDWVREPAYEYKQLSIFDVPGIETINRDDTRDESFELPSFFL